MSKDPKNGANIINGWYILNIELDITNSYHSDNLYF